MDQCNDIVLLHGWGMRGAVWSAFAGRLSGLRPEWSLHTPDLPGYGGEPLPAQATVEDQLDALLAAAPGRAWWCGWSLGGLLALALAERAPGRVAGLVLLAATPRFTAAPDWGAGMPPEVLEGFAEGLARDHAGTLGRFFGLVARGADDEREVLRELRRQVLAAGSPPPEVLALGLACLQDLDLRGALRRLPVPVALILGANDRLVAPGTAEAVARLRPDARIDIIAGAGHAPFLSHPEACAEILAELIRD